MSAHCQHTEAPNGGMCSSCTVKYVQAQIDRELENQRLRQALEQIVNTPCDGNIETCDAGDIAEAALRRA